MDSSNLNLEDTAPDHFVPVPTNGENEVEQEESWYDSEPLSTFTFSFRKFLSFVGPGFLMSQAYLDPGNIAGDLNAGLKGQYHLFWTLFWSTVLGLFYQILAIKIGVCT